MEDIERVRQVFGDQKLSIYGLSYGTKVMGLYATIFPANVNLMILDSNMGEYFIAAVSCVSSAYLTFLHF